MICPAAAADRLGRRIIHNRADPEPGAADLRAKLIRVIGLRVRHCSLCGHRPGVERT